MTKLFVGRETESGEDLYIDSSKSHVVFVAGKRGSGKSYTLGVFAEELYLKSRETVPIIIDTMGIYWTMALENTTESSSEWGITPQGLPVRLIVPGDPQKSIGAEVLQEMEYMGVESRPLTIPPSDIEPDEWLDLFGLSLTDPMGILLYKATAKLFERWEEKGEE